MSVNNLNLQQDNSVWSDVNDEEKLFQTTIKQLLQTRLFLGHYQEKRYVESLNSYRDVIVVSNSEMELRETLEIVLKRLNDYYYPRNVWFGITTPNMCGTPVGYCFWTELPATIPFGKYWFQIKTMKFRNQEIMCKLKCVRPMITEDTHVPSSTKYRTASQDQSTSGDDSKTPFIDPNWNEYLTNLKQTTNENLYYFFTNILTLKNIGMVIKFLSVLLVSLLTGSFHTIKYVGDFSLRFMHEFSNLIHAATPIFLGIIDLIAKVIGGFYILIAMLWKGSGPPPTQSRIGMTGQLRPINYYRR